MGESPDPLVIGDRFVSGLEPTLEPERLVRRLEVINGAGGRRRWSADEKAGIVAETLEPGAVVSEVARRHGLTPQQVFTWRREARGATQANVVEGDDRPAFVPAVLAAPPPAEPKKPRRRRAPAPQARRSAAPIELEIDGVVVRIGPGADAATVAAVIAALRATS